MTPIADRTLKGDPAFDTQYAVLHWAILNASALAYQAHASSYGEKGSTEVFSLPFANFEESFPVPNQLILSLFGDLRRQATLEAHARKITFLNVEVTFRIQDHL